MRFGVSKSMAAESGKMKERVCKHLEGVDRLVVKVGTNLIDSETGFNMPMLKGLIADLAEIHASGKDVLLVTSGAVGAGRRIVEHSGYPKTVRERQACAALGQAQLMHLYQDLFQEHGCRVAQVLLTEEAIVDRERYVNAQNTLEQLLLWRVIPIINENDTIATEELKFGDNDRLSALVAAKVNAQVLILLTDVDGLYDQPPSTGKGRLVEYVENITPGLQSVAGHAGSQYGIGGMRAKLDAAEIAMRSGIFTSIANGNKPGVVPMLLKGKSPATWFLPTGKKISSRKAWVASRKREHQGRLLVDNGAKEALLNRGTSLLPSGVCKIEGEFLQGDTVAICDADGVEFACGLVNFSHIQLKTIMGKKTSEVEDLLGSLRSYEVVHRDNLVMLK